MIANPFRNWMTRPATPSEAARILSDVAATQKALRAEKLALLREVVASGRNAGLGWKA
jgi:hypothetical protein